MRIESSSILMSSTRNYLEFAEASTKTTLTQTSNASSANAPERRQDIAEFSTKSDTKTSSVDENGYDGKTLEEYKLEIVLKMLKAMSRIKGGDIDSLSCMMKRLSSESELSPSEETPTISITVPTTLASIGGLNGPISPPPTQWKQTTITSAFYAELENTSFETTGIAKTTDGREISFNVSVEMTHAFCERYTNISVQENIYADPLVINLSGNYVELSDQKFLFDINSNGQEELISFTERGSGFLALDKNGDSVINDGSELFGTRSGNGFADLAAYDSDGNNWIDEADAVFNDLKVWTKDEKGNNVLLDLKRVNVGAIFLGNTSTQFSLKDVETNQTNGIIRTTGIFLKESGAVGTIQHVDLTI